MDTTSMQTISKKSRVRQQRDKQIESVYKQLVSFNCLITRHKMSYQQISQPPAKPQSNCLSTCPIIRYNYFIKVYQQPSNKIPDCDLQYMPENNLYSFCFTKVKTMVFKVIIVLLLIAPIINILIPVLGWYCLIIYYYRCGVYQTNKQKTTDPFVNMVYDPNICQGLGKDHYFFEVELRELQGFTFNYNDKLKDQLNLRKERGKVRFMVYNGQFWAHYYGFIKYKKHHVLFVLFSTLVAAGMDVMWYFVIF